MVDRAFLGPQIRESRKKQEELMARDTNTTLPCEWTWEIIGELENRRKLLKKKALRETILLSEFQMAGLIVIAVTVL